MYDRTGGNCIDHRISDDVSAAEAQSFSSRRYLLSGGNGSDRSRLCMAVYLQFQLWPAECVSESNRASGVDPLLAGRSEYRTPDGIHTGYMAVHRALHDYPYERDFRNPTGSL